MQACSCTLHARMTTRCPRCPPPPPPNPHIPHLGFEAVADGNHFAVTPMCVLVSAAFSTNKSVDSELIQTEINLQSFHCFFWQGHEHIRVTLKDKFTHFQVCLKTIVRYPN